MVRVTKGGQIRLLEKEKPNGIQQNRLCKII
jgi:hypothetical protein